MIVARAGRGRGYLRIAVRREPDPGAGPPHPGSAPAPTTAPSGTAVLRVRAEVANFYPLLRGGGRFARLGVHLYSATQLRIHVLVMHGFLRSLARLELPPAPPAAPGGERAAAQRAAI